MKQSRVSWVRNGDFLSMWLQAEAPEQGSAASTRTLVPRLALNRARIGQSHTEWRIGRMKEYTYKGESFLIEDTGACEIKGVG